MVKLSFKFLRTVSRNRWFCYFLHSEYDYLKVVTFLSLIWFLSLVVEDNS